ncbi:MAG: type II secretion system protein GspG [Planctomycetes bacterium]|nr:type II secretion system protein GspG [Planctomycetota bacterium]
MTAREDSPTCDQDHLWALAVGVLEEEERQGHEEHVTTCSACQERLGVIRADVDALGCYAGPGGSPEGMAEAILARSRGIQTRGKRFRWLAFGAVLISTVVVSLTIAHGLTQKALVRRDLWRLDHAVQRIQNAEGKYPANEEELSRALVRLADPELHLDAEGRPLDPLGQPFRYRFPGEHVLGQFDLWSIGANGVDENGGPDDQTNWPR